VKRYHSDKTPSNGSWRHVSITLAPLNPQFAPIVLTNVEEDAFHVVAELVEVLREIAPTT
ncbi:MAG TPA: hypothetical protein VM890_00410, partial [Longimicrobium sp.]|nr:hypothetical protein [Longimicrobium sp.]